MTPLELTFRCQVRVTFVDLEPPVSEVYATGDELTVAEGSVLDVIGTDGMFPETFIGEREGGKLVDIRHQTVPVRAGEKEPATNATVIGI